VTATITEVTLPDIIGRDCHYGTGEPDTIKHLSQTGPLVSLA